MKCSEDTEKAVDQNGQNICVHKEEEDSSEINYSREVDSTHSPNQRYKTDQQTLAMLKELQVRYVVTQQQISHYI